MINSELTHPSLASPICQDVSLDMIDVSPANCRDCQFKYVRRGLK